MDIIQLPSVPITTPLTSALGIMRASHRSAVVTQAPRGVQLVSSQDVRLGINRDQRLIRDLEGVEGIPFELVDITAALIDLPPMSPMGESHRRLNMALFGPHHLNDVLSRTKGDYAVIGQAPGVAFILTRQETKAALYAEPPTWCACRNPNFLHEYGAADNVTTGQQCRHCSYQINCG